MKNGKTRWIIIGVVIVGIIIFTKLEQEVTPTILSGVESNGITLKVIGYDENGVAVKEFTKGTFSLVGPPGSEVGGITSIAIAHTISQLPTADVDVDVTDLTSSFTTTGLGDLTVAGDGRYDTALDGVNKVFTKFFGGADVSDTSATFSITDLEDDCGISPYCEFKLQLIADFDDIDPDTGALIADSPIPLVDSFGSIVLRIAAEGCPDGTPFGACSASVLGEFCDGLAGLIDCADPTGCTPTNYAPTSCTCAAGFVETDGDAICTALGCLSGAIAPGECTGTLANTCGLGCAVEGGDCPTEQNCYDCGQTGQVQGAPIGWLDATANAAECPLAYDGVTPADTCHETQKTCKYKGRKPDLDIIVI